MNNEPVAWMDANDKTIISNEKKWANDIPLYTHPHPDNLGLAESIIKQQELRIAELEKDLELKTRDRDVFRNFTLAYEERIAELEKELKRTKFAWNLAENEIETLKYEKSSGVYDLAKTLTADEINQVAKECKWDYDEMNVVDFGRAILRKASEK